MRSLGLTFARKPWSSSTLPGLRSRCSSGGDSWCRKFMPRATSWARRKAKGQGGGPRRLFRRDSTDPLSTSSITRPICWESHLPGGTLWCTPKTCTTYGLLPCCINSASFSRDALGLRKRRREGEKKRKETVGREREEGFFYITSKSMFPVCVCDCVCVYICVCGCVFVCTYVVIVK